MKKVLKNIVKSVAYTALVSLIVLSIEAGIHVYKYNKAIESNEIKFGYTYNEIRHKIDIAEENEGNVDGVYEFITPDGSRYLSNYFEFELLTSMLVFSLAVGSIIGIIVSIDENSNKKVFITYILMIPVIILLLELNEKVRYDLWIDLLNLWDRIYRILGFYTLGFTGIIVGKRFINKRKVKYINKELK